MKTRKHPAFFTLVALIVFLSVFIFISKYLSRIRASTTKAFVSFTSSSLRLEAEQPTSGSIVNKISAFDLTLTTDGTELITTVGNPSTYPAGDTTIFTPIIAASGLPATTVHIAYVIQKPTQELPVAISIPITTDGAGNLSLEASSTQEVVGYITNATDNVYQVTTASPPPNTPTTTGNPPLPLDRPRAVVGIPAPVACTAGQTHGAAISIIADQPVGGIAANKISAFDLTIVAGGGFEITNISAPATYPGGDTSIFTAIIVPSSYPVTQARLSYVIQKPTLELPTGVVMSITTRVTATGTCSLTISDSAPKEVVGAISGDTDNTYKVVVTTNTGGGTPPPVSNTPPAPSNTPPPQATQPPTQPPSVTDSSTPQPSPTGTTQRCNEQGDSDCDGDTDDNDYKKWRDDYDNLTPKRPKDNNPNFFCKEDDGDSRFVDMKDFEVWRRGRWKR